MNRRQLLQAGLAAPLLLSGTARAQAPVFIGDMHFHSFFADSKYHSRPVAATFAAGAATLVAWSIVADLLWIKPSPRGIDQTSVPKVGEPLGWFEREIARVKAHIAEQGLKIVREPGDVDQALKGVPHVVLAVEGSNFIEDDPGRVKLAYDLGVRHLQLVHYTRNTIGCANATGSAS